MGAFQTGDPVHDVRLSPGAEEALAGMGRTEDIRFSPDNRRMGIAAFVGNACFLFGIAIDRSPAGPAIRIDGCLELRSQAIREPHGIEFVGADRLLVANRAGGLALFSIPERITGHERIRIRPIREIRSASLFRKLESPGSLCLAAHDRERAEVLVCNNYAHRITRHVIPLNGRLRPSWNSIHLDQGFQIPDGIAMTSDRSWLAVSNHNSRSVLMFDRGTAPKRDAAASGTLVGAGYPHGIRFSGDGHRVYVADAGAPFVHLYESRTGGWSGTHRPAASIRVLDEARFLKGHLNPEEGGPKGIDLSSQSDLLAVTCEQQPLAFFRLS